MYLFSLAVAATLDPAWIATEAGAPSAAAGRAPAHESIRILYADGKPSASPDPAEVEVGGTITWHTEPNVLTPFQILPKRLPADARRAAGLRSHRQGDHQELTLGAGSVPGRYSYGIEANGHTVDPDVVIRPR